jgi:hypothetical protein
MRIDRDFADALAEKDAHDASPTRTRCWWREHNARLHATLERAKDREDALTMSPHEIAIGKKEEP